MHQYSLYYFDKTTVFVIISEKKLKSCTFGQFLKHFKPTATNIAKNYSYLHILKKGVAKHIEQHLIPFVPIIDGNMVITEHIQKTSILQ